MEERGARGQSVKPEAFRRNRLLGSVFEMIVIARGAKRAAAIQLDCFVVPQSGTSRNDGIRRHTLTIIHANPEIRPIIK
jgi:hypothetical protein